MSFPTQEIVYKIDEEYITISGMVHGIDTSQWPQGTELHSSQSVPGEWTDEKPSEEVTFTATVVESDAIKGSMLVFPVSYLTLE